MGAAHGGEALDVLGAGSRAQGAGRWALGAGRRAQGAGRRVLGAGSRALGVGCLPLGSLIFAAGLLALGRCEKIENCDRCEYIPIRERLTEQGIGCNNYFNVGIARFRVTDNAAIDIRFLPPTDKQAG